jgi:CheY-like chemotaxis protein
MRSEETIKFEWHRADRATSTATASVNRVTEPKPSEAQAQDCKRILVADCSGEMCTGLVNLLESVGYEVVSTRLDNVLELAGRRLPDAVLLDIDALHLEGLDIAGRLRELAQSKPLLLIALTGWAQPQYRDMAIAAGFDVHLVKPVGLDQLTFLLSMTLG